MSDPSFREYYRQTLFAVALALALTLALSVLADEPAPARLSPQTVAEQIVAEQAVLAHREAQAGKSFRFECGGVCIYAGIALPAREGGSLDRRSHLERHGPKYAAGVGITAMGAGVLAWLNNSEAMGGPHYGRGTAEQQDEARNQSSAVTVEASNEGEGRNEVNVTVNQGGGK